MSIAIHICEVCGQRINGGGRISIDYQYAYSVMYARELHDAQELVRRWTEAGGPEDRGPHLVEFDFEAFYQACDRHELWTREIRWYAEHVDCAMFDNRAQYDIALGRLQSYAELYQTTAHLSRTKNWFRFSDWFEYWDAAVARAYTVARPKSVDSDGRHDLYRFFDENGLLLYVGITKDFKKRKSQHAARSQWFHRAARHTLEPHPSRAAALAAEAAAILEEQPLFNRAGVGA